MLKKIITVTMVSGLLLMASVGGLRMRRRMRHRRMYRRRICYTIRNSDMKWIWITRQATRWGAHM